MLRLLLGISGTGKTGRILAEMKARAAAGKRSVLLVPEQFSSSAETMVYRALGDALSAYAEVYSFTSFAEQVLKAFGGVSAKTLTDAARAVAVRRAMDNLGDELQIYRKHRRSTGFCGMCADAIKELKTAGADPQALLDAARSAGDDGEKLHELGLIFAAYEAIIAGSAMDPSDRITAAAHRMELSFLEKKAVYIDNFDGFTAPEYRMLERLVQAPACTVALCCDTLSDGEAGLGLFSPVKKTAQNLRRIAGSRGVPVEAPHIMQTDFRHKDAPGLAAVNACLAYGTSEAENTGVYITPAAGVYAECKAVACRIAALVRENGMRYAGIAVICRDLDAYTAPIQYEFALAGIPYFNDAATTPEHTAPAAFFGAALSILTHGLATEPLLRLLKTDLCGFAPEEIAALENYAYTWQLKAADWRVPFDKSPSGFGAQITPEEQEVLAQAEHVRAAVVPCVERFVSAARGASAAEISKQLYLLLESLGGMEHTMQTAAAFEQAGDAQRAAGVYSTWDHLMDLLGQMEQLLGDDEVTAAEYADLFHLLLQETDLGHVPQTQDAVIVTTADRMRLDSPDVCFVLGMNEGQFPKLLGASGLLSHADRDLLVQNGVEMPGSYENRTLLEQMFFYRALTAPAQRLYISYIPPEAGGAPLSAAMEPLVESLSPAQDVLDAVQLAPTPAAALDLLGASYREDTPQTAALQAALRQEGSMADSLSAMERAAAHVHFLAQDTQPLHALLGDRLTLSPTRVEQYYRCRFSYFLQYVLRIQPRKRAELSPLESGSLIHYILEHVMRRAGADFPTLAQEDLARLANEVADQYVAENMPAAGQRFAYLVDRLKRGVLRVLTYLQAEQAQSLFHPVAFEQEIGTQEGAVPPLTLQTPDGRTVQVRGKIDRVDVMRRDGKTYLRVVDYKTGSKSFSLDEVYCGLNTQMLLYLFTLCRNASDVYQNPVAAGVLYLAGDPAPQAGTRAQAASEPVYHVDGLVLDDELVIRGMDRDATGLFVPFKFGKNGTPRASAKLAALEKLGNIEKHLEALVTEMARGLYAGEIDAMPLRTAAHCPCDVCEYRPVCLHEDGSGETMVSAPPHVFDKPEETEQGKEGDGQ